MRKTEPAVRLISAPEIRWREVMDYLESVGGMEWYRRKRLELDNTHGLGAALADDAQNLIEFAGRLCYRSWEPGLNANVTRVRTDQADYLENILRSAHGSVLEHANFTFLFSDVSRVFTHELVRHRAGSAFSQESMRFVRLTDIPFWNPEWADDPQLQSKNDYVLEVLEKHQRWMAEHFELDDPDVPFSEKKAKTSYMRRFAPDGVSTVIVWTANVRTLRHVIAARTNAHAEEEIRLVFGEVAKIMQKECPYLFGDFVEKEGEWVPQYPKV